MNKLVSKNPILRFKLGNRIEKLKNGRYIQVGTSTFGTKIWVDTLTGHLYKTGLDPNVEKMNLTPLNSLGTSTSVYSGLNGRITINGRDYIRRNNSNNRTQVSTGTNVSKTAGNGLRAVEMNTSLELAQKANLEKMMAEEMVRKKASSVRKPAVKKPTTVTKPAAVTSRAATGYTIPNGITDVAAMLRLLKDYYNLDYVNSGVKIDDGIWGKLTQAAWEAWKNKLAADAGGTTGTTPNVIYTPANTGTTVSGNGYSFTLPTNTNTNVNTNANTNIYESYYPGTYNAPIFYNGRGIRKEGKGNYTNRSEYWDWLLNNKNSNLYKLWSNVFGNDGYLNEEIYNNMMSLYGINDEDFNSKKLATLLNDLNLIGVKNSDARKAFLTNFDRNLPSSEEINEYVRTNTPVKTNTSVRPNLSTINWGTTPSTISSDNPFNIDKSKYPHLFAKNGGLISRNPINRFKVKFLVSGTTIALKNGGNIPKFKEPWQPIDWSKLVPVGEDFVNTVINNVKQVVSESDRRNEQRRKADRRANRSTRAPFKMNNTAKLQEALYNAGMYKGIKDRKGNELSFEKAVDGQFGNLTEAAVAKAKEMGYDVNINKGTINKSTKPSVRKNFTLSKPNNTNQEASFFPNIFNFFSRNDYIPSNARNMLAVMEHKVNTGVIEPYFYINPREGKLYRLQGDLVLYETPIATGVNFGSDGFVELPKKNGTLDYDRSLTTSSTPAGIFTLSRRYKGYNDEPSFHLIEAERGNPNAKMLLVAMHAPASAERQNRMMKGEKRLTYGCILLPNGEIKCEFNKGNINKGDSVYIEPTVEGNYLYEDKDGLMKTHFKETPKRVTGDIWGKHFDLNNVRYNTGY